MRVVFIAVIVAALVIAGITATLIQKYLSNQGSQTAEVEQIQLPKVLVAITDLPAGAVITDGSLAWREWPEKNLNPDYIREEDGAMEGVVSKVMKRGVSNGEPLLRSLLFDSGQGSFLAGILKPGMRSFTIDVRNMPQKSVAGMLSPGDMVDVFISFRFISSVGSGPNYQYMAEPVVVNTRIIAVDQNIDDLGGAPTIANTITIEVTPKQVEVLMVAKSMGDFKLVLHSLEKAEKPLYVGNFTTGRELSRGLGGRGAYRDAFSIAVEPKPVSASRPRSRSRKSKVTIYRRTEVEELEFKERVVTGNDGTQ